MRTATLDVGGMLSMLDYQAVEKQLGRIPGVQRATASIASNSVTVEYDETVTSVAGLKNEINECGFHWNGQIMPKHLLEPHPNKPASGGGPMKPAAAPARAAPEPHVHVPASAPAVATPAVRYRTTWRTRWATAPAWTCRPWCETCGTASGSASRLRCRSSSTRPWATCLPHRRRLSG